MPEGWCRPHDAQEVDGLGRCWRTVVASGVGGWRALADPASCEISPIEVEPVLEMERTVNGKPPDDGHEWSLSLQRQEVIGEGAGGLGTVSIWTRVVCHRRMIPFTLEDAELILEATSGG